MGPTAAAAPQYGSTTAWWSSHRRRAWTTSAQSRGQTNTAAEHMQSWKGCICMVQIPLSGKYTWVFKEKRNKPTHVAHLNFKVLFCCWGCLPCWSSGFKHHPLVFNQELIYPHLWSSLRLFHPPPPLPLPLLSYAHGAIEGHPAQDPELVSTFHVALGDGKSRMDGHTCKHMLRGKMGLVTHCNTFSQDSLGWSDWEPCQSTGVLLVPRVSTIFVFFSVRQFALVPFAFWKWTCTPTIPETPHDKRCGLSAEP